MSDSINLELVKIKRWTVSNNLTVVLNGIFVGNDCIQQVESYKFVGLILDHILSFSHHIESTSNKISKAIGILYKIEDFLPRTVLITLYNSIVRPHFAYGIEAYCSTANCYTNRLGVMQRKVFRIIFDLDQFADTNIYFSQASILKIDDMYSFMTCVYIYKALNGISNFNLFSSSHRQSDLHSYLTRNRTNISLPQYLKTKT